MTRWLVTRHPGARAWIEHAGIAYDHHVDHLDPDDIAPGDIVIGSLPINLAATVCARGARYLHLTIHLNHEDRGRELSLEELSKRAARLEEYVVERRQTC